jgi:hypothetical protein
MSFSPRLLWILLLVGLVTLSCSSYDRVDSGSAVQIERIESVAKRISSGKLTDPTEIAEEFRSCKNLLRSSHDELAECRAENKRLSKEILELAEDAGRGRMLEWLYWATIGGFVLYNLAGFLKKRYLA